MTWTIAATGLRTGEPRDLLLLDADGTLRHGPPDATGKPGFVNGPDDVRVDPYAARRIGEHRETGGRVAIVSNQGGIAAGFTDPQRVAQGFEETLRQLRRHAGTKYADDPMCDVVVFCAHDPGYYPDDGPDRPRERCWCRKPAPGLLILAADLMARQYPGERYLLDRMLMVGDQDTDRLAAKAAGVAFKWAADWRAGA